MRREAWSATVARFLGIEAAGGILLLAASAIALIWANSPWSESYVSFWQTEIRSTDFRHLVNDGLMAVFFFVVGLEIKRELVAGQLSDRRDAVLPAIAAVGGMIVPAVLYALLNAGGDGSAGWGIPMATDIAFAVGVLVLFGDRLPASLKLLLLSLAIVDDIGAITVIAVFYTEQIALVWCLIAVAGLGAVAALRRLHVSYVPFYAALAAVVWASTLRSGVHATIAGVALGLMAPARPGAPGAAMSGRLEEALHPWTSFLIVPVFALANAGIPLSRDALADAVSSTITIGVVVGLVLGKPLGVLGFGLLAVRLGWARLPDDIGVRHLVGLACLAGIGFTVSIFVTGLAFDDVARQDEAKIGVLAASGLAALLGTLVLRRRPVPPDC